MKLEVDIFYIIVGLFLGLCLISFINKPPKIIIKYPSIETIENTTYIDDNNKCFKYYAIKTNC